MGNTFTALPAQLVLSLNVRCEGHFDTGQNLGGNLRVLPITGGSFTGSSPDGTDFMGTIMPGGADWNTKHSTRYTHMLARYVLRTDDGIFIDVANEGTYDKQHLTDIRSTPRFITDAHGPYAWLNTGVYVGRFQTVPQESEVRITVFRMF